MERLYLKLRGAIPNVDHINAVDHNLLADIHGWVDDQTTALGVARFNDFYVYKGSYGDEDDCWYPASDGLATMRTLIEFYEANPDRLPNSHYDSILGALRTLAELLDEADSRDIPFCLVGDY